ncbi:hypothetical protein [Aminobacter sp. MDW-2]|uniref:hypothetical protein n=1 Tax=Aminobacter sp. MDW-2 TaxID=2666139 RepID=UPI0012B07553|nr:hypothetical protein [Aminobacter sp. MDW-2]MRX31870.1 hypothetical protein [Aminobacter sp. MDW-2]QNH32346.1 hypothetical protein H5P29_17485 [Aminobacter sp. MDW-2]
MADVDITPKIRCDNCGKIEEKTVSGSHTSRSFSKPKAWGSARMEGARSADSYGGKSRLDFTDLCPRCADAALDAASEVLAALRSPAVEGK